MDELNGSLGGLDTGLGGDKNKDENDGMTKDENDGMEKDENQLIFLCFYFCDFIFCNFIFCNFLLFILIQIFLNTYPCTTVSLKEKNK